MGLRQIFDPARAARGPRLLSHNVSQIEMSVEFKLTERVVGFAENAAMGGEQVRVISAESLTSLDGLHLTWRLEELHNAIFSKVPSLPSASLIDSLLIIARPNLDAIAYINELQPTASVRVARAVAAGEPLFVADVLDVLEFNLGVEVPADCGFVLVRSHGWRKALYYDLCPLGADAEPRVYDVSEALAKQTLALIRGKFAEAFKRQSLRMIIDELERLIAEKSNDESRYQELFQRYPWILSGQHTRIERHANLDDENIPDFTGVRATDSYRDIFEIKPPFMPCFRKDGELTASFNDAWSQVERYLNFARQQRQYLRDKGLLFENPRCFLIAGYGLSEKERQALRVKESFNNSITVLTYEQVLAVARAFLDVLEKAAVS
jgi:hypothetical protein